MTRLFPAGGQRGTTVTVECTGKFNWPVKIWAPGVEVVALKDSGQIQVTIPADLAADRVWIRLYDAEGASPAFPFLLSNLPEFREKEPNNRLGEAQPLPVGTQTPPQEAAQGATQDGDAADKTSRPGSHGVANGVLQAAGDVDGFAVYVKAGSTLVADMAANARLNSPVDAALQVVTPDGFVVAENHDGVGIDPRLAFTPTETGTYIVRVFGFPSKPNSSITYSGAATYVYRLTLTTGPFIANAAPVSVAAGTMSVPVFGWNIPEGTEVPVRGGVEALREVESVFAKQIPASSEVGFVQGREFAGRARIRRVPFKTVGVARPGGGPGAALAPPVAVTGCLDTHNQITRHVFQLKKGTTYSLSAESSTFELPVVPLMRIMA
ncbi:MAG: PPC domain-containing protein, partial [Planctomycetaceae bacterium]